MATHIQQLQEAIITTISKLFRGDFSDICEVKKAVLHLEAIYFCYGTGRLLNRDALPMDTLLAWYRNSGLLPQDTVAFFSNHRRTILAHWPEENAFSSGPEILYESLLASELSVTRSSIGYKTEKVSRDMAGAYYTSSDFAVQITRRAIDAYIERSTGIKNYSVSPDPARGSEQRVICALKDVSFLDYSCGCGDFLIAVLAYFEEYLPNYPVDRLLTQLNGVDVDPIAVMITIVRLLAHTGQEAMISAVSRQFTVGNPLIHTEGSAPLQDRFSNFALNRLYAESEGLDSYQLIHDTTIILGNPPWEKLRFEECAFFKPFDPDISKISRKQERAVRIAALETAWPQLAAYYKLVQYDYTQLKKTIPKHPFLKESLVGELNTYALFAELASCLAGEKGFAAIIVKSTLVSSACYSSCFRAFMERGLLSEVFLYENQKKIFPIDSREKFCVLFLSKGTDGDLKVHYGLTEPRELLRSEPQHVTFQDLKLINPETGLLPNVADADEFSFLLRAHRMLPVFAEEFPDCHFGRLVHLTAHDSYITTTGAEDRVPICEGKFIGQYDNRFATFAGMAEKARYRAKASATRQPEDAYLVQKPPPESRYFIDRAFWESFLDRYPQPYSLCWRSLTSATNQRTMIASVMPTAPTCQSIQMLQTSSVSDLLLILALFNSKVFDFFVRLKMTGIDLTQSIVRQIPVPPRAAWDRDICLHGVSWCASEAVMALERLIYRKEPGLNGLWRDVAETDQLEPYYDSSHDIKEEIDEIVFRMYGLTEQEEQMIRGSFSG